MKCPKIALTKDIEFDFEYEYNGEKIKKVTMKRPKLQDQLDVKDSGDGADQEVLLVANMTKLDPAFLKDLYSSDYTKLHKAIEGFLS